MSAKCQAGAAEVTHQQDEAACWGWAGLKTNVDVDTEKG